MHWTSDYFTSEYLSKYRDRQAIFTAQECDFIQRCLCLDTGNTVLDVACGYGRHVHTLLDRGIEAYGIDACELFIAEANTPRCRVADMRSFECPPYDAAYNFFTSFGYFSDEENEAVIDNISRVILPGGRFLLHVRNREWLMRNYVANQWDAYGDNKKELTTRRFDLLTSRMEVDIEYWPSGKRVHQSIRAYTAAELVAMFARHGLTTVAAYGGIEYEPYRIESEWLALVAEKV